MKNYILFLIFITTFCVNLNANTDILDQEVTIERDTSQFIFSITHHLSDLQSQQWLDTSNQWYWIFNGIAIYHNGCWQRYTKPRYSVIILGKIE